jgi:hypothetical protein
MPGLFGDAAEYGRGLLAAYDKWPGLAGLLGMPSAAAQIAQAGQAAQGKPLNDRGAVQAFLDSPVAMMMSTDPIRRVASPIRAYHGSPHDFDRFDLGKIGTGEGAQAYGHGLYFAENEGVARSYKAAGQPLYLGADRIDAAKKLLDQYGGDRLAAISAADANMRATTKYSDGKLWQDVVNNFDALTGKGPGRMYEVNLHADPQRFLDWDKPLSGQAEITKKLNDALVLYPYDAKNGKELYEAISKNNHPMGGRNSSAAADLMQQSGIPGIRYLDQGSRGAGSGTSNYVVFDPSIIEIMRKYGIAAPVATAATGGLLGGGEY